MNLIVQSEILSLLTFNLLLQITGPTSFPSQLLLNIGHTGGTTHACHLDVGPLPVGTESHHFHLVVLLEGRAPMATRRSPRL